MTISQRQFALLTEMGISLWQRKSANLAQNTSFDKPKEKQVPATQNSANIRPLTDNLNLIALKKQPILHDIAQSIALTIEQIILIEQGLKLGSYRWLFTAEQAINFQDNTLITPPLSDIAQSSILKRQLWQTLQELQPC